MNIAHPQLLWLLLFVPVYLYLMLYAWRRYRQRLQILVALPHQARLLPDWALRAEFYGLGGLMLITSWLVLILALARPQWGFKWQEVQQRGADVMLVLDVSRSMSATDISPNRLVRAKREILDLLRVVRGDRVGLVLFAGVGFVQCPLTQDMSALELFLQQVDTDSIPVQGTSMGQAIRMAMQALGVKSAQGGAGKAMILISDGEDQESEPIEAAEAAAQAGIVIHTISVGGEGAPIPLAEGGFLRDSSGAMVLSKPDETVMRRVAEATQGRFLRSSSGDFGLEALYRQSIRPTLKDSEQSQKIKIWNEVHPWLSLLAALLLIIEGLVASLRRRSPSARSGT